MLSRPKLTTTKKVRLRRWLAGSATFALAMGFIGLGGVAPADAAPSLGLSVTPLASEVKSGETITYTVAWSCSSTTDPCLNGNITVPIPVSQPSGTPLTYTSGTSSTGGFSAQPTVVNGVIKWDMSDLIPAGSSGQVTFTLKTLNLSTPDNDSVTPTATFTVDSATQSATGTATVRAILDLHTDKRIIGNVNRIALDEPVTYQISTMHFSSMDHAGRFNGFVANGTWGLSNIVTVDHLPTGAEFISATGGGIYDPVTHTVTWPAWSDNVVPGQAGLPPTPYQLVLKYRSAAFETTDRVTNTATATAKPHLRDELVASDATLSHGFIVAKSEGTISKGGTLAQSNSVSRGSRSGWGIQMNNLGTSPLTVDVLDYMPCLFTSPTDGSTDCSTPAVKQVAFGMQGSTTATLTIGYTTNLGNTGAFPLVVSQQSTTPITSDTEWITSFTVTGQIPGGQNASVNVNGFIVPTFPASSEDATYFNPAVPNGVPPYIENCLSVGTLTTPAGLVVGDGKNSCGYLRVLPEAPLIRADKIMTNAVQGVGGQIRVRLSFATQVGGSTFHPVLADLLPAGLRFVPGSVSTTAMGAQMKAYLPDDTMQVEIIDDYADTGRQLVRISWPDADGVPIPLGLGNVDFAVEVQPGAAAGQFTNDLMVFDGKQPNLKNDEFPNQCFVTNPAVPDTNGLSPIAKDAQFGCTASAPYTIIEGPAVGGTKWVKGSLDEDYLAAPSVGVVTPGDFANYRLDVANTGNVPITDVVAYEILPYLGDTGVGPAGADERGSEWQALLTQAVTTEADALIQYSLSSNPCRGEVIGNGVPQATAPAGCVNDWTETIPLDPSGVRAIRIDFGSHVFAVGETQPIVIEVTTPSDAAGTAWNSFAVAARNANSGAVLLPVEPNQVGLTTMPSLTVEKTAGSESVSPEGELDWTIRVTNDGSGRAGGVVVLDELPEGLVYLSSNSQNGAYDPETGQWVLERELAAGASATITITTRIAADRAGGVLCNTAVVSVTVGDQLRLGGSSEACTNVIIPSIQPKVPDKDPNTGLAATGSGDMSVLSLAGSAGLLMGAMLLIRRRNAKISQR